MKKILITGGAGFIGSKVAIKLLECGYDVRILDNLSSQIHVKNSGIPIKLKGKVDFIRGDVRSIEDWRKALNGVDAVIHLAAETGTGQSMYEIYRYTDVNVNGTSNLLEILVKEQHSIEKVVLASSRAIYGEGKYICKEHGFVYPLTRVEENMSRGYFGCRCPICGAEVELTFTDEESIIHPTSIYGITKLAQEQMVMITCKGLNIPAVIYRYQNVYGPGQSLSNPYTGILSIFSTRIKNSHNINIFEDGKETRDFVYIDDVVEATILGLTRNSANYQIFNVGSGIATDVLTVANLLKKLYKSNVEIKVSGNYRLGDIRHNCADISKIKNKLNFQPKYDFATGIDNFINWVNKQDILEDKYEDSIKEMKVKGLYK